MGKIHIGKRVIIALWLLWEKGFHNVFHLRPVHTGEDATFLYMRVRKYRGAALNLENDFVLHSGDWVAELHMDNELLLEMSHKSKSTMQLAIFMIRAMARSMPYIAELLRTDNYYRHVRALYGVTMVNRGVRQFGFTVVELPKGLFFHFTKMYLRLLLVIAHPKGRQRLTLQRESLVPKMIVMPANDVMRKYPNRSES